MKYPIDDPFIQLLHYIIALYFFQIAIQDYWNAKWSHTHKLEFFFILYTIIIVSIAILTYNDDDDDDDD